MVSWLPGAAQLRWLTQLPRTSFLHIDKAKGYDRKRPIEPVINLPYDAL